MGIKIGDRVKRVSDGKVGTVMAIAPVGVDVLFDGEQISDIVLITDIQKV